MSLLDKGVFDIERSPRAPKPQKIDLLASALQKPVALLYGRHIVAGNVIFEHQAFPNTLLFLALGEGELDGVEVLWINGLPVDLADTTLIHLHPGLEGELGVESAPSTRNQKICSFIPAAYTPQPTFSRTAYLALALKPDLNAPTNGFSVIGIYRGLRVRIFDNAGTQTAYQYSTNPAWVALDLLIRRRIKPRGKINEALTTSEKALIDFAAFKGWADACDVDIGGGKKRWEANVAFTQKSTLSEALSQVLILGRAYMLERGGKFAPFHDEARASTLTLGRDELLFGSLEFPEKDLKPLPNEWKLRYRALDTGIGPGTISTTGTAVTGTNTDFLRRFKKDMALQVRSGAQSGEARKIASVDSDLAITLSIAFSANQSNVSYANPALDFQDALKLAEDNDVQDQVGRVLTEELDLGNNTGERAERLGAYLLARGQLSRMAHFRVGNDVAGANDILPGDVVTSPDDLDYGATRSYEVLEITDEPDGSREIFAQEYDASVFTDVAGPQQPAAMTFPPDHLILRAVGLATANLGVKTTSSVSSSSVPTGGSLMVGSFTVRIGFLQNTFRAALIASHALAADGDASAFYKVKLAGQVDIQSANVIVLQGTGSATGSPQVNLTEAHQGQEVTIEIWGANQHTNATSSASGSLTGYPTTQPALL